MFWVDQWFVRWQFVCMCVCMIVDAKFPVPNNSQPLCLPAWISPGLSWNGCSKERMAWKRRKAPGAGSAVVNCQNCQLLATFHSLHLKSLCPRLGSCHLFAWSTSARKRSTNNSANGSQSLPRNMLQKFYSWNAMVEFSEGTPSVKSKQCRCIQEGQSVDTRADYLQKMQEVTLQAGNHNSLRYSSSYKYWESRSKDI